jgi:hypothetical protein
VTNPMPMLNDVTGLTDVAVFLLWTFALIAASHALFRSFLAAEIAYRFSNGPAGAKLRRMKHLRWEIEQRQEWSAELEAGSPLAARRSLSAVQVAARARELERLARGNVFTRAAQWFTTCMLCQVFWVALAACLFCGEATGVRWVIATALGHAGLAVALSQLLGLAGASGRRPQSDRGCPGGNCPGAGR